MGFFVNSIVEHCFKVSITATVINTGPRAASEYSAG